MNKLEGASAFKREVSSIPISKIKTNPYQPRKFFSENAIKELARSIREVGLLQPITLRSTASGYELVAGERRLRACKMLGMKEISAIGVPNMRECEAALLAMIENLQREDLHFLEEAEGYQSLMRQHGLTQEELGRRLSKSQSCIANKVRLLRLPRSIKEKIISYQLTERHARALMRLPDESLQNKIADRAGREGLSVMATENLVEQELARIYVSEDDTQRKVRCHLGHTIYLNSIRHTIEKIRGCGAEIDVVREDKPDKVVLTIEIPKVGGRGHCLPRRSI
ncbi:MAG: ParB/RepB/Spo0J family partition protein [Christensenellaceae bacterium]